MQMLKLNASCLEYLGATFLDSVLNLHFNYSASKVLGLVTIVEIIHNNFYFQIYHQTHFFYKQVGKHHRIEICVSELRFKKKKDIHGLSK